MLSRSNLLKVSRINPTQIARAFSSPAAVQNISSSKVSTSYKVPSDIKEFGGYWRKGSSSIIQESDLDYATSLRALHARLGLKDKIELNSLARTLICQSANSKYTDNLAMASFGKNLLNFYVYEYFLVKYPRLTPEVLQSVADLYLSTESLYKLASDTWGVEEDTRSALERYLSSESQGGFDERSLFGKLIYSSNSIKRQNGVIELLSGEDIYAGRKGAHATFVRALIGGIYAHSGIDATKEFIHNYIIKPKKLDLKDMLIFDQPTRELSRLCVREGLEAPVSRLLVESGRFSSHPVFVVGVFSGEQKLGEGQGASLIESKTRAAVNALKAWYLYSPLDSTLPSDSNSQSSNFEGVYIDKGSVVV